MKGIRKNDIVMVVSGKDGGKIGKVLRVIPKKDAVLVERVNMVKRHTKPSAKSKGGIMEKEGPLHVSNVMLVCPRCKIPTRIGSTFLEGDGPKTRICKKCSEAIDG